MRLFTIFAILFSFTSNARLLDKVAGVINGEVITLSQVKRVQESLKARKSVSPFIYRKSSYSNKEVNNLIIKKHIIRSKLKDLGYIITDAQVESEIRSREQKLGLSRTQLEAFLKGNGTSYEEFSEITREAIEYNQFNQIVIIPLVSVSEQEIKNAFFKSNINNKTVSFKYTLVDFTLNDKVLSKKSYKSFRNAMINFQKGKSLPKRFSSIESTVLGDITADGLTKDLKRLLKNSNEGEFTMPINMMGKTHIFFVKKRDVVDSEKYLESKNILRNKIFEKKALEATDVWFKREFPNHYIKQFI